MASWRLAPSLAALGKEVNDLYPDRDKSSDGTIGDADHASRVSDHNPDAAGWVHARDITNDPAHGFDAGKFARTLAARRDPRVNYIISNGEIWKSRTGKWERYTGPNGHFKHAHVSIHRTDAARNDTSPWLPWATPVPAFDPGVLMADMTTMYLRNQENGEIFAVDGATYTLLNGDEWKIRVEQEKAQAWPCHPWVIYARLVAAGRRRVQ